MTLRIVRDEEAHALVIEYEPGTGYLTAADYAALRPVREVLSRSSLTNVDMQDCDCFCDHTTRCENGCYPADTEPQLEWSEWTCIGGTMYKLYDARED